MSPKEKACDIVGKFHKTLTIQPENDKWKASKQCALIAVEEILKGDHLIRTPLSYWQQVKTEIEKL